MMEDLSLHILDIAENSAAAGATRLTILVNENERRDVLSLRISDNGRGMSRRDARRALDPFFSTRGKRTGFGLPLLAQTAEHCGGGIVVTTALRRGTKVAARFRFRHIDRPPLTSMTETLLAIVFGHPEIDVLYRHRVNGRVFRFASRAYRSRTGESSARLLAAFPALRNDLRAGLRSVGRA